MDSCNQVEQPSLLVVRLWYLRGFVQKVWIKVRLISQTLEDFKKIRNVSS